MRIARQFGVTAAQLFQWRKGYLQGSLGANETVVPASALQDAMRRIQQLGGALGCKTLENEFLKEAVDFAKKKVNCALASIARRRAVKAVCWALGVPRCHVLVMPDRLSEWMDSRKSPPRNDDAAIKQAIANAVQDRATYGYCRAWARLRLQGHDQVNHKRVYQVMRDAGWLL